MTQPTIHRFTREELYQAVWAEPIRLIARRLDVSAVALAKACRRAAIPTPEPGYWMRRKAGKPSCPPHSSAAPASEQGNDPRDQGINLGARLSQNESSPIIIEIRLGEGPHQRLLRSEKFRRHAMPPRSRDPRSGAPQLLRRDGTERDRERA